MKEIEKSLVVLIMQQRLGRLLADLAPITRPDGMCVISVDAEAVEQSGVPTMENTEKLPVSSEKPNRGEGMGAIVYVCEECHERDYKALKSCHAGPRGHVPVADAAPCDICGRIKPLIMCFGYNNAKVLENSILCLSAGNVTPKIE